jgi:pyruvate/2-oxoglutarate dehydrogenase complex dihydrolipoamide acyltransferase (E2) component
MAIVRQIPTGCAVVEADVTALDEFYRQERDAWLAREGFPLTYTPFFLYALAQSLQFWPVVRQALRNGQREQRDGIHVGVAVALENGLIVPVLRNADQLDLPGVARAQNDLVVRARTHRLQPEDVTGGIATLTNVGSMGGLFALPMLNENQAVILGVGAVTRRAVGTSDGILYHSCAYLSLTFDRRLLDDLQAERFLLDVVRRIKQATWREEHA